MTDSAAIAVIEFDDYTAIAEPLGFRCSVSIARSLCELIEPVAALARLRDALFATLLDHAFDPFRAVALRGEPPKPHRSSPGRDGLTELAARCTAGIGGVADSGTILGIPIATERGVAVMMAMLGFGVGRPEREPVISLSTIASASFSIEAIAMRMAR